MKNLIKAILKFLIPVIVLIIILTIKDVFKVYGFQDYYSDQTVGLNRETICTETFLKHNPNENFNSFIIGSSRSQAFRCDKWTKYLDSNAKPFHFDGSGDNLWGMSKKVEFLDKQGVDLDNVLLVLDRDMLRSILPNEGHLSVPHYKISGKSKLSYYWVFFKASLSLKFLTAYTDFSIFKTKREYMGYLIQANEYGFTPNNINCDLLYGQEELIKTDSSSFYENLIARNMFYERPKSFKKPCPINDQEKKLLKSMARVFKKHKSNLTVVISPVYDQIPMEKEQIDLLKSYFGDNIFNFSGVNKFTNYIHNYYEASHYRPKVANEILKEIYKTKPSL